MKTSSLVIAALTGLALEVLLPLRALRAEGEEYVASEVVTSYVSGTSPTLILSFDNNLEICLALRSASSLDELRMKGITATRSQILLLRLWGLIDSDESGALQFALPVIDAARASRLAELADIVATDVLASSSVELDDFVRSIHEVGWSEHTYLLVGSYVLDGLVWIALEREGMLETSDPGDFESGSEYWSGLSWVNLNPMPKPLGTNSMPTPSGTIHLAWTPASLEAQQPLQQGETMETIAAFALGTLEELTAVSEELSRWGLVNDEGEPGFPVIGATSVICEPAGVLAQTIAEAMTGKAELREMMDLCGTASASAALIMAHHWVYPALLRILQAHGLTPPRILSDGAASDLARSLYVTYPDGNCFAKPD